MFGGNVGVYTGIKRGAFSISENSRNSGFATMKLLTNIALIY